MPQGAAACSHYNAVMQSRTSTISRTVLRYFFFALGTSINSFGIAFITKAELGTSPISSVPYVLSLQYPDLTFGQFSMILNVGFVIVQIVMLRRDFHLVQLLQLVVAILFSAMIDVSMGWLAGLQPTSIIESFALLLVGCAIMGVGISVEVAPKALLVPGEGVVGVISLTTRKKFGSVKVIFDVTLITIAVVLSFVFFGQLRGLGVGTIVAGLLVGRLVNLFSHKLPFIAWIASLAPQK